MLNLDISKETNGGHIVHGRVGDNKSCIEKVSVIKEDGTPFDLTGLTITFMGNTYNYQTKVISSDGIEVKDAKKGLFQYTFPSEAFGVAGPYERSYFQFTDKNGVVATTGDFEVIVLDNTDLTANEAETIISEYNKLVEELQQLQKKSISDLRQQQEDYVIELAQAFAELKSDVATLESKIKTYETGVSKTATDAQNAVDTAATNANNTISTAATNAAKMISDALEEFQKGNFYTKLESDERFAKKVDLTKENVQLGNVDNYATANQTEAEQGIALNKFVTPMGVKQHVDARMATQEEAEAGSSETAIMTPLSVKQHFDFNLPDSIKSLLNLQSGTLTITGGNTGTLNWVRIGDLVFCMVNSLNGRSGGGLESSIGSMPFKAKRYLEFLLTSDDRSAMNSSQLSVSTDGAIRWKRSSGFGSNYHGMFFYEIQE
ncbi:BppU family phage baseplate upper protein [Enterococcus malodoratus]|uniref:BppU family phage baseplate upper protein n=1 Tax=Enterococcus malodoratus TaxID=71451 RepID=UPI003FCF7CE2